MLYWFEIAVSDSLLCTTVLQGTVNSTNSNTAIVVSERPQVAQFGAVADLVTSHTTSSVIPTASTLEVIVENIGTVLYLLPLHIRVKVCLWTLNSKGYFMLYGMKLEEYIAL